MQDNQANLVSCDVTYRIEEQDLAAALQLHNRSRLWSWQMMVAVGLMPLIAAVVLASLHLDRRVVACASFGALIGGLALPRATIRWYLPIAARRWLRKKRDLRQEFRATWDAEGLRLRSPGIDAHTPWAQRRCWRDDAHVVLLYLSDNLFHFLPKRVLSQEQVARLRACAADAGVCGASAGRRSG